MLKYIVAEPFSVAYLDNGKTVRRHRYSVGDVLETTQVDMTAIRYAGGDMEHLVEPALFNTLLSKCMVKLL